jgi:hypothetical protein
MRSAIILVLVVVLALHQDWWLWRQSQLLLFGILPPGLTYHAMYTIAAALLMAVLVKLAWPAHLEREAQRHSQREDKAA